MEQNVFARRITKLYEIFFLELVITLPSAKYVNIMAVNKEQGKIKSDESLYLSTAFNMGTHASFHHA
jgi:hypothetical protein